MRQERRRVFGVMLAVAFNAIIATASLAQSNDYVSASERLLG